MVEVSTDMQFLSTFSKEELGAIFQDNTRLFADIQLSYHYLDWVHCF